MHDDVNKFYNYSYNTLRFCFLVQIRDVYIILTSVGLTNLNTKGKRNGFWK